MMAAKLTLALSLLLALTAGADARRNPRQRKTEPVFSPPPYLELAQQALLDGDLSATTRAMKAARDCYGIRAERCGFTAVDFDSLAGVIYLERGQAEPAAASLRRAVTLSPNRSVAWFYLGQAELSLGHFKEAAAALTEAAPTGKSQPAYYGLLMRAWVGANEPERARQALALGLTAFKDDPTLLLEGTRLFLAQGLHGAATDLARRYAISTPDRSPLAFFLVAESLRARGWLRDAAQILEEARLLAGPTSEAAERLAYVYAEAGAALPAALLFESLTTTKPALAFAASEQYRLCDHTQEALRLAATIEPELARRTQLAAIHLQRDAYDAAFATLAPLAERGLLDAQGLYRLAYAAFRMGAPATAASLLKRLKVGELEGPKRQLEAALKGCQTQAWACW